ncbi:thiosulfate transmembrane transporter [Aureococcus anophagefferens]|nr:thiosulfate transmembrane transporter [Aureococcus anophagefferens]
MGSGPAMLALLLLAPKRPRLPRMAAIINPNNTPKRRRGLPPLPTALVRGGRRGTYPELTPATLAELARGAVVTDLGLSRNSSNISRDEFTLLLLVKQGLVAPGDLDDARARFDALDADKTGVLSQADLDLAGDARRAASRPAPGDGASEPAA